MKAHYTSLFILFFSLSSTCYSVKESVPGVWNVTISPPISNVVHFSPIFNVAIDSIKPYFEKGKNSFNKVKAFLGHTYVSSKSLLYDYRGMLFLGSIVSLYLSFQGALAYISHELSKKHWWSFWLEEVPFSDLCLINIKELGNKLVRDIQGVYMSPENPVDLIQKFTLFLSSIQKERYYLNFYLRMARVLSVTYLNYISCVSPDLCEVCVQRLERLDYIEYVLAQWISDYTIGQSSYRGLGVYPKTSIVLQDVPRFL